MGHLRFAFTIAIVLLLSLPAAAAADTSKHSGSGGLRDAVLSWDFTSALQQCTVVPPAKPAQGIVAYQISDRELTSREAARLGEIVLPNGNQAVWTSLLMILGRFYEKNGRLPMDGFEAMSGFPCIGDAECFSQLSDTEKLESCYPAVNPITGRVYDTFQATRWAPGSISVTIVDDPAVIAKDFPPYRLPLDWSNPNGATRAPKSIWVFKIYGEKPETSLLDFNWAH